MTQNNRREQEFFAAIDLGSNSFHMIVARVTDDQLVVIDRVREMVRLADGMDIDNRIQPTTQQRALDCLKLFAERLKEIPSGNVRVVGTNTLRNAENSLEFLELAEDALGLPIEIISGIEEARLVYLGVTQSIPSDDDQMLVIDIGGGSTEMIIGKDNAPVHLHSLEMGCVTMTQNFFRSGKIKQKKFDDARTYAEIELEPHVRKYRKLGWTKVIGTSGTIRAIARVSNENGWCNEEITCDALKQLLTELQSFDNIDEIKFTGLGERRRPVFIGGVITLASIFDKLKIEQMQVSDGALREGILHDLIGRKVQHQDIRIHSINQLATRYNVDQEQAARINTTVLNCLEKVAKDWRLDNPAYELWLSWAATLHEIGLSIAFSRHHQHAAYIIEHCDLAGFSQQDQQLLALLVRSQRKKFPLKLLRMLPRHWKKPAIKLAILLRLGVVLHRNREEIPLPLGEIKVNGKALVLTFPQEWLVEHPLTEADIIQENSYLQETGFSISLEATE